MANSMFSPLKKGPYKKLFVGELFSDTVDWLDFTALTVLVAYTWQLGPEALAALMIAIGLPWVVLGPLVSVWADRFAPRKVLLLCVSLRVVVIAGFLFSSNLYTLLPLVFLKGTIGSLFMPARQGAIRAIVPKDVMSEAISLSQLSSFGTKILAPALGGAVIAFSGTTAVFVLEIVFLFAALFFLIQLPVMERPVSEEQKAGFWQEFREGLDHIRTSRMLAVSIFLGAVGLFLVFLYDGLLVLWSRGLTFGEAEYGMLMSAMGLGSVAGAVVTGQFNGWKQRPLRMMCFAAVTLGLINVVIGLGGLEIVTSPLGVWLALFLLFGIAGAVSAIPFGYILQAETPAHLIGRVSGVAAAAQNAASLFAPAVGAAVAKWLGVGGVFTGAGLLMTALAVITLLLIGRIESTSKNLLSSEETAGVIQS